MSATNPFGLAARRVPQPALEATRQYAEVLPTLDARDACARYSAIVEDAHLKGAVRGLLAAIPCSAESIRGIVVAATTQQTCRGQAQGVQGGVEEEGGWD